AWRVETDRGPIAARTVVVATGMDHTPVLPDWPGRGSFAGELIHSAEFRNPGPYRGRDVLVVGAGNSACEIADLLARGGAGRVRLAVRTPPLILPRRLLGISITAFVIPGTFMPDGLLDRASRAVQRVWFGDLTPYGLPPSPRGVSAQRREGYVAPVDSGFVDSVKRGRVEVVEGVERLDGTEVGLAGGRRVRPDAVIAATGYRTGLAQLVGHLCVLRADDERPLAHGGASPPGAPGLHFIGFHHKLAPTLPHVSSEARGIGAAVASSRSSA
ncbi:MAG TPA: NAD(P)/FAD-dependent oxidoreductase, partial [Thermoleophilaceae bacterium]|nr:NAD(P)/FAD-dependent oxidoreductase [Thermoleophilaceae bacterium]